MVNVSVTKIDSKGRIQLPATFIVANDLKIGQVLTLKPMVNKKNSVAIVWEEKNYPRLGDK